MLSIYYLSWNETSFFAKLLLFFKLRRQEKQKIRAGNPMIQAEGYSTLSSSYYNIAGTAMAQFKKMLKPKWLAPIRILLWCFSWLPLTAWCFLWMLSLSNRVVKLIGYKGMSAEQCNIQQSILRHYGWFKEAKQCIELALIKSPAKIHTTGLLQVGLAETFIREKDFKNARYAMYFAIEVAEKSVKEEPNQAIIIFRHCASIADRLNLERQLVYVDTKLNLSYRKPPPKIKFLSLLNNIHP